MVDGYGWPVSGIFDLGWEKVTKFRVEPAFYSVEVNVLVNQDTWKSLNDAQRSLGPVRSVMQRMRKFQVEEAVRQ